MNLIATKKKIMLSALLVSFAGVLYELAIAQILSATLGGTYLRYTTTIGIFTFILGLSALFFEKINLNQVQLKNLLLKIQLFCCIVSTIGIPYLFTFKDTQQIFSYIPSALIAFSTGLELPILFSLSEENDHNFILALDYLGMFIATIMFPTIILLKMGAIAAMAIGSIANLFVYIINKDQLTKASIALILLNIIIIYNRNEICDYISTHFF